MKALNHTLRIETDAINQAIRELFAVKGVSIDEIIWNPNRGGLVNDRFSIHSVQVTIGEWQKTVYSIETRDIVGFSTGETSLGITRCFENLMDYYPEDGNDTKSLSKSSQTYAGAW